jgi:tetratricopeptide (TPR) repeat protein
MTEQVATTMEDDPLEKLVSEAEADLDAEDVEKAAKVGAQALALAREKSEDIQTARALRVLVGVELLKEQFEAAEDLATAQLELFQELGCMWGEAAMLLSMAEVAAEWPGEADSTRTADALQFALEALDLFRDLQDIDDGAWYMEGCVLLVLITVYHKQNKLAEVRSAATLALQRFQELGDIRNEGRALHGLALAHAMTGKTWDAVKQSQKALWIFQDLGLKRLEASERLALATWYVCDGDWPNVLEMAEESLKLFQQLSISSGSVAAVDLFAKACCQMGESERALNETQSVLKKAQKMGGAKAADIQRTEASLLEIMAGAHLAQGKSKEAVAATEKALAVARKLKDEKWQANLLYVLAQTHLEFEQWAEAWERAHEAAELSKKIGENDLAAAVGLHIIVTLQLGQNAPDDALATARSALKQYQRSGDETGEGTALYIIGCIHFEQGEDTEATSILRKAQEMFQESGDYKMEAKVCWITARTHLAKHRSKEALRLAYEARKLYNKAKDPFMEVRMGIFAVKCHMVEMEALAEPGKEPRESFGFKAEWEKASKLASSGKNIARKLGEPSLLAEALVSLGNVALVQNKTTDAMSAADEALDLGKAHTIKKSIAAAQILRSRILHVEGKMSDALEAAQEGLKLSVAIGDSEAEEQAKSVLDYLKQAGTVSAVKKDESAEDTGPKDTGAVSSVAVVEDTGPVVLDQAVVQSTLDAILNSLIGNDVEADIPFMDAGVDSLLGIQLRTEMQKAFGGLKLGSTLVFDYPSARSLVDHVVELSAAAIEG